MIMVNEAKQLGLTPAEAYLAVKNFSDILESIKNDVIPTGTNQPFPVFSQRETQKQNSNNASFTAPFAPPYYNR